LSDTTNIRPRFFALALVSALSACSNDVVDLGGGTLSQSVEYGSRCAESPFIEGDVRVRSQQELDALLGCEEIHGDLSIDVFEGTELAPLADLRAIDGNFFIGRFPDFPDELTEEAIAAWQLEYDRVIAIAEADWLSSLEGVESLERVGGLTLNRVSAPSLEAFGGLRLVSGGVAPGMAGFLAIASSPYLVDLSGLENVRGFRTLELSDNPALESLDGLTVPSSLDDVTLQENPALTNIDALSPLETIIFDLFFVGIAVTNLDALANLKQASRGLALFSNPELIQVDALQGLEGAEFLVFDGNAKLERLPQFENLYTLDGFKAMRNPALESISLNFPNLQAINIVDGTDLVLAASVIEIGENPRLESIAFEAGFRAAEMLSIYRNDALASIDLGSLERLDRLDIYGNTALTGVSLGALRTVDSLRIIGNPSLTTSELRNVLTFESEFTGNADDPPPAP
jgi:hypothetical protein